MKKLFLFLLLSSNALICNAARIQMGGSGGSSSGGVSGSTPSIGGQIIGGADQSVLFIHPDGVLSQNTTGFFYNTGNNTLTLVGPLTVRDTTLIGGAGNQSVQISNDSNSTEISFTNDANIDGNGLVFIGGAMGVHIGDGAEPEITVHPGGNLNFITDTGQFLFTGGTASITNDGDALKLITNPSDNTGWTFQKIDPFGDGNFYPTLTPTSDTFGSYGFWRGQMFITGNTDIDPTPVLLIADPFTSNNTGFTVDTNGELTVASSNNKLQFQGYSSFGGTTNSPVTPVNSVHAQNSTAPQLRLAYDSTHFATMSVTADGDLVFVPNQISGLTYVPTIASSGTFIAQPGRYISAIGATTANSTTNIVGLSTNFLREARVGDQISLAYDPTNFVTVLTSTGAAFLTVERPIGNGTNQNIGKRQAAQVWTSTSGVITSYVNAIGDSKFNNSSISTLTVRTAIIWPNGTVQVSSPTSGGSGGVTVYSATATAGFPFGFSASTATFSGLATMFSSTVARVSDGYGETNISFRINPTYTGIGPFNNKSWQWIKVSDDPSITASASTFNTVVSTSSYSVDNTYPKAGEISSSAGDFLQMTQTPYNFLINQKTAGSLKEIFYIDELGIVIHNTGDLQFNDFAGNYTGIKGSATISGTYDLVLPPALPTTYGQAVVGNPNGELYFSTTPAGSGGYSFYPATGPGASFPLGVIASTISTTGKIAVGTTTFDGQIYSVSQSTVQLKLANNTTSFLTINVSTVGITTFDVNGTSASVVFPDSVTMTVPLTTSSGGTGLNSASSGAMLWWQNNGQAMGQISPASSSNVLHGGGGSAPTFTGIAGSEITSGLVTVARGGTNIGAFYKDGVVLGSTTVLSSSSAFTVNISTGAQLIIGTTTQFIIGYSTMSRFDIQVASNTGSVTFDALGSSTSFKFNDNVIISSIGAGIRIAEGTDATSGTATLSGGTITVNTKKITANSHVFAFVNGGTITNIGFHYEDTSNRVVGTSFVLKSSNILDASTLVWLIIEPY